MTLIFPDLYDSDISRFGHQDPSLRKHLRPVFDSLKTSSWGKVASILDKDLYDMCEPMVKPTAEALATMYQNTFPDIDVTVTQEKDQRYYIVKAVPPSSASIQGMSDLRFENHVILTKGPKMKINSLVFSGGRELGEDITYLDASEPVSGQLQEHQQDLEDIAREIS